MNEIIYFIITIGILVFVHEFGHFAAAKISKMRVDVFAIGFGFRLFGWNKISGFSFGNLPANFDGQGNTDYRVSILPLGGYVKIAGMVDESLDLKQLATEPQQYEFRAKSTSKKVFVITAGVLMNLLLSLAVFWSINLFIGKQFSKTTTIVHVEPKSLADSAGFLANDKIISINGKDVKYWEDVKTEIFVNTLGSDLSVKVLRNEQETSLKISRKIIPQDESKELYLLANGFKPVITDVLKNSPADSSGIKSNDIMLSINNEKLFSAQQTKRIISSSKGKEISLSLLRSSDTVSANVKPRKDGTIGILIGGSIYLGETEKISYNVFESFVLGLKDIGRMTNLTLVMMKKVVVGEVEFKKAFGGPIKIAQFAAKSADNGIMSFLMFLALLSLSLAIINIFPFPALDGGHLIFILIEAVIKKEIPIKVKVYIQNAGMALLLLLMAFILYNDILNL